MGDGEDASHSNDLTGHRDNQLATYLVDVDIFVTTDNVFVELADAMRPHCPAPLAETRRSPSGSEALTFVLELLQSPACRERR
jgi:hypothetical protein